ncbi:hypothetical protein [Marmoricola sp. RAF53]|uniref:hypothetical protein n=1 Tax=Marmoricola sp. RAF53 TaxID=3233059 RepID=UPI003F9D3716
MVVLTPDGRGIEVRRRWLPWRLRKRKIALDDLPLDFTDGLEGLVIGIVVAIVFVLFGGFIIFGFEAILLLLLLVPLFALARMFWILPWIVEASYGDTVLGKTGVRGWRDSEEKIRELAGAYQRGEDPFETKDHTVG